MINFYEKIILNDFISEDFIDNIYSIDIDNTSVSYIIV
jgi:hypothetical protein